MSTIVSEKVILDYLKNNKRLTIAQALINWQLSGGHITKLISNLRKQKHDIKTIWKRNPVSGRRYVEYILISEHAYTV